WPAWHGVPEILMQPPWSMSDAEARALMLVLLDTLRHRGAVELLGDAGIILDWSDLGLTVRQSAVSLHAAPHLQNWAGPRTYRVQYLTKLLEHKGLGRDDATREATKLLLHLWEHWDQADAEATRPADHVLVRAGNGRRLNPHWLLLQDAHHGSSNVRASVW